MIPLQLAAGFFALLVFSGCIKDHCRQTYSIYFPVWKSLSEVRANMKSNTPQTLTSPGKYYIYDNYIFLNERDKGIHVIDNSVPASPRKIAFISIPGNLDLAVQGTTLYADSYTDLVAFDISSPTNVVAEKIVPDVFPHRGSYLQHLRGSANPDSIMVIVDWQTRDTVVDCDTYVDLYEYHYVKLEADNKGNYASPNVGGRGGSMARFTLRNNYLYTVTADNLNVFDVSNPFDPFLKQSKSVGWNIETIFPFRNRLFIGSSTGMYIFDLQDPASPVMLGQFNHLNSCDPVIADDQYAYVTLRSGNTCGGAINQLEVVDIRQLAAPQLLKTYPLTNPHGLSKDEDLLFICDGRDGLKIFDASVPADLKLIRQISGFSAYDVIAGNKLAVVVAEDGLYQFNYFNENNIQLVSKILIGQ